ncbi:MAG: DUF2059 domain-containing protein [Sulfitobacter sp.]|nr:DUF2059 domain-containing protein [Sulfitobacter sp.]
MHRLPKLPLTFLPALLLALTLILPAPGARAANEARIEAFLETTGFDVALESIRLSADSAPSMLGIEAAAFGSEWSRLVREVFDTDLMHDMAGDILGRALTDDLLTHASDFYASGLGQRLVEVENDSHMEEDDALKTEAGQAIVAGLVRLGSPRLEILKRLNDASGSEDSSIRAIHEVQVRFLMAAAGAGVIELRMDEPDLREALRSQEGDMRTRIKANALANAAYTYQSFSDRELTAYAEALEHPKMRKVYELMNAVQYEIMANRFEAVAARLADMQPSQDL